MDGIHPHLVFRCQLRPPLYNPLKWNLAIGQRTKGLHGDHIHQLVLYHGLGIAVAISQHGVRIQRVLSGFIFLCGRPLGFGHQANLHPRRLFSHQAAGQLHHLPGGPIQVILIAHTAAAIHVVGKGGFAFGEIVIGEEQPVRRILFQEGTQFLFNAIHQSSIKSGIGYQLCPIIGRL